MNAVGTEPVESKGGVQLETQLENELGHVIRWIGQSVEVTQLVESEEVLAPAAGHIDGAVRDLMLGSARTLCRGVFSAR